MEEQIEGPWRKATFSGNGGGDCVEVANSTRLVLVRDTKDRGGVTLGVSADAWRQLLNEVQSGRTA
jgi:hypothetical protein